MKVMAMKEKRRERRYKKRHALSITFRVSKVCLSETWKVREFRRKKKTLEQSSEGAKSLSSTCFEKGEERVGAFLAITLHSKLNSQRLQKRRGFHGQVVLTRTNETICSRYDSGSLFSKTNRFATSYTSSIRTFSISTSSR